MDNSNNNHNNVICNINSNSNNTPSNNNKNFVINSNSDNNNNNKYNLNNSILFFKIFKNVYIKHIIFKHLKLFSFHYSQYYIKSEDEIKRFNNYPYKSYIRSLKLHFNNSEQRPILLDLLRNLPEFVEEVEFDAFRYLYREEEEDEEDEEEYLNCNESNNKFNHCNNNNNINSINHNNKKQKEVLKEILEVLSCLPSNIKVIRASSIFNSPLPLGCLPDKLESFIMSNSFNLPLYKIPAITQSKTITTLTLGNSKCSKFNQQIPPHVLPENLTILDVGYEFNQDLLPNSLPSNLLHLSFGSRFNRELGLNVLPSKLKTIYFGDKFNSKIKPGVLPASIQVVEFSPFCEFNQSLGLGTFPSGIHTLKFGVYFQKSICCSQGVSYLPSNLRVLVFNNKESSVAEVRHFFHSYYSLITTNIPVIRKGSLPQHIEYLQVGSNQTIIENSIPSSVTSINGCKLQDLKSMPKSIHTYTFDFYFNSKLIDPSLHIKNNITQLIFGNDYNSELDQSFSNLVSVTYLEFGYNYNKEIGSNVLPLNLKTIVFGHKFNQIIKSFPESLENILFGHSFNMELVSNSTLSYQTSELNHDNRINKNDNNDNSNNNIGSSRNNHLFSSSKNYIVLPNNIKSIKLGYSYNHSLERNHLFKDFSKLRLLELGVSYIEAISFKSLPPNLETLNIRGCPRIDLPLPTSLNSIYFNNSLKDHCFLNNNINQIPILLGLLKVIDDGSGSISDNCFFLKKLTQLQS